MVQGSTVLANKCSNLAPCGYLEIQEVDVNIKSDDGNLSPDNIADKTWELYQQPRDKWQREIEINE